MSFSPATTPRQHAAEQVMHAAQQRIVAAFEELEGHAGDATHPARRFINSYWEHPAGNGGRARVITDGALFERGGVNVSAVQGQQVPLSISHARPEAADKGFYATGISLVMHPRNPYVPTFHANFRYFDLGSDWWFGGGLDLTPMYVFDEDAAFFHHTLQDYCAQHPAADYPTWKATCDDYFYVTHRHEMRGIGGIFFDHLRPTVDDDAHWQALLALIEGGTHAILDAYLPIVRRRMHTPYGDEQRHWQLYRRGRYVEFNLFYDRGTLFGLQTDGNIEAILMSLPPLVRWEFEYRPRPGSPEAATVARLQPHNWAAMPRTEIEATP